MSSAQKADETKTSEIRTSHEICMNRIIFMPWSSAVIYWGFSYLICLFFLNFTKVKVFGNGLLYN